MPGFIDDLLGAVNPEEPKKTVVVDNDAHVEDAPNEAIPGPTGTGGNARTSLYGEDFMRRYGNR